MKLPDDIEDEIEDAVDAGPESRPTGAAIGRLRRADDALERYGAHLLGAQPDPAGRPARRRRLRQRRRLDRRAGDLPRRRRAGHRDRRRAGRAEHQRRRRARPTSTAWSHAVRSTGADLGIAHDGDADRCLAVDASGTVVDGDQLLAICALALRDAGQLRDDTVVATVMSNLGFHHAMRAAGIERADHRGRRPLRARGAAGQGPQPRRRAERAHRLHRRRHHRRRPADRAARDGPHGRDRRRRWPSWPRSCTGCRRR